MTNGFSRKWQWVALIALVAISGVIVLRYLLDTRLRPYLEQKVNNNLQGYTAQLGAAHLHLFGFALELNNLVIRQEANPEPPVIDMPLLTASVQWRALLYGRVVADMVLERPAIYLNRKQTLQESADTVPVQDRGWQEALQSLYPLKINEFRIVDGDLTYIDKQSSRPLQVSQLHFRASNIRNIQSPEQVYPSDIHLDGVVFATGKVRLDGQANFLAVPHPGVKAAISLDKINLEHLTQLTERHRFTIQNGTLSGTGQVEYAPTIQAVDLQEVKIVGVKVNYRHTSDSKEQEKAAARKIVKAAQKANNNPELHLQAKQIDILQSTFSFEDTKKSPDYKLFLTNAEFHLRNFTNHLQKGTTVGSLAGKFMGEGATKVGVTFRPEHSGPDFDLDVQIAPTSMRLLNKFWRAYGNFDVNAGLFSFYSELKVKNGALSGYVKPLFTDMDVYDARQDKDKNVFQQIYEGIIGGFSWLLENPARDEVATVTTVSGKLDNPETSTWEALGGLVQNAFFKAILPGFEKAIGRPVKNAPQQEAHAQTGKPK